jgi:hypothetical protein
VDPEVIEEEEEWQYCRKVEGILAGHSYRS